ncbi:MAG TPA: AarF/UbiB family protein [Rubricoccaceae bacterium]|nr:AarF/UbiB family protein [Rubricoccaceae bacterium]
MPRPDDPRRDPPEPVPFSETAPGAEPPRPEPEGDAVPPEQAPEPALATSLEAGPTATAHADASPPAEPRSLRTPHSALRDPESERALVDSLVARWRAHRAAPAPHEPSPAERAGYEEMPVAQKPPGLVRRFLTVYRHATGLVYGAAVAVARDREQFPWVRGFALFLIKVAAFFVRPLVRKDLRDLPLQVQLRRRLELLGPTYIKLGQVLALREDLLPSFVTEELKNLLDRLPVMPFEMFLHRVEQGLGRPVDELFAFVDPIPLGSASIGQIHAARLVTGEEVILKVVKPHIYVVLKRDARLLGLLGSFLQVFFSRYQPKRLIDEFTEFTLREVDLRREADNAEQFALNFADEKDIRFPRIYRACSSRLVLTMERFTGLRPDSPEARALPLEAREHLVDLGAEAIIRMLYHDGFFHADLHPGNLFILDAEPDEHGHVHPRIGFIDLGMVGFFDGELRRTLMYYYFSLVTGDAEGAARYLTSVAQAGLKSDPQGFKRAVAEICRRFYRASQYGEFSIAQLIMESVSLGGQYRMYFPIELVLMTKALVTFEGVGQALLPGIDVAKVSQRHVSRLFRSQFNPVTLLKESFRNAPELVDLLIKSPSLAAETLRFVEQRMRHPAPNPLAGIKGALLSGSALVSGTVAASVGAPWYLWLPLFLLAGLSALKR